MEVRLRRDFYDGVPHPYGSHITGPAFIMYVAGDKYKPRLLPLRGGAVGRRGRQGSTERGGTDVGDYNDDDDPEVRPSASPHLVLLFPLDAAALFAYRAAVEPEP